MARGRMLNKSIGDSRKVAELVNSVGPYGGLFFTWLIAHLDADGRVHGDPDVLKGKVAPRVAGITPEVIRQTAGKAHQLGLIVWYEADGDSFIHFPGFEHNQPNMRREREPKSLYPTPTSEPSRHIAGSLPAECRQSDGSLPPEEKRREGKGREEKARSDESSALSVVDEPPYRECTIPTNTGDEFVLTMRQVDEWRSAYPGVDVDQAIRHIRQWSIANPTKRKTCKGMLRFIVTWLGREQDRRPARHPAPVSRQIEGVRAAVAGLEAFNAKR